MFQEFPDDNINDNFLSERRQKISEQSMLNVEERKNEIKRSKSVFMGAVGGLALAGIVGWFALSPRYASENVSEIPVIRRTQTAVKVLPTEPGGMEILNQDKTVYDIIDKQGGDTAMVESILPPPEQPLLPEIKAESETTQSANASTDPIGAVIDEPAREVGAAKIAEINNNVEKASVPAAVVNEMPEVKLPTIKEVAAKQNKPAAMDNAKEVGVVHVAQPQPVAAISKPAAQILSNIAEAGNLQKEAASSAGGDWQIQLMSSPNRKAVESAWGGLVRKYSALAGQPHEVETANLGAKGTYYRLQAGAFMTRSGADRLCADLKKQGGSCIVKKK